MALTFIIFVYNTRKIWLFKIVKKKKLKLIFISFFMLVLLFGNLNFNLRKSFEIHFLDVGQGDSCLIRTSTNKVVLIDRR